MEERYGVNGYIAKFCGELLALWLVCCWWERRSNFYLDGRNRKLVFCWT